MKKNLDLIKNLSSYNKMILDKISPFTGNKILNLGSGHGAISYHLKNEGKSVVSIDKEPPKTALVKTLKKDIEKNSLKEYYSKFDSILCVNVLEHIKSESQVLLKMNRCLKKNGKIILIIPAFDLLYGITDSKSGHYRRYSKKKTVTLIKNHGFRIKHISYMNILGFFGWLYQNRILKSPMHKKRDLRRYDSILKIIWPIEKKIKIPFGLSLFCVAEKVNDN